MPDSRGDADQSKRDVDVLTPAQVDRLAAKMPAELRASVVLAAWCGLRWGETSELRRADVSKDASVLRVRRAVTYRSGVFTVGEPKTSAGVRDVAVPPHIRPMIKAHLRSHVAKDAGALLFAGEGGSHLRATCIAHTGRKPAPRSRNRTCACTTYATSVPSWPPNQEPPQPNSCTGWGTPHRRWRCGISTWPRAATPSLPSGCLRGCARDRPVPGTRVAVWR